MKLITIDFETAYSKEYSLSKMTTESYVRSEQFEVIGFAVKLGDAPARWCTGNHSQLATVLKFCQLDKNMVLAHNAAFDMAILNWHFDIRPAFILDTLSMARPLHNLTVGGSLKALAEHYGLGAKGTEVLDALGKWRKDFTKDELAAYGRYCVNDVELTYQLFKRLAHHIPKAELKIIDLMVRMFTEPVIEIDAPLLQEHLAKLEKKKEALLQKVTELVGDLSLASNPQFAKILEQLGVPVPMKISPRTGKPAPALSKKDVEFKALEDHEDERVQMVVAARLGTKSTQEETRTKSFLGVAERGPLPIMLNYYGAHTGRASGGEGLNLQNLPSRDPAKLTLRRSLIAPAGHSLIACDSSQIEARVVAYLAGQDDLVKDFQNGEDIYSKFATDLYGTPISKANKTERTVGKVCILGLGYGMGKDKLQATLKTDAGIEMSVEECEKAVALYRQKYGYIVNLWSDSGIALSAIAQGSEITVGTLDIRYADERVYLPNGLFLAYPNIRQEEGQWPDGRPKKQYVYDKKRGRSTERVYIYGGKAVENKTQALARIIVFDQMAEIARRYKVVLTVHDEVVCCVPDEEVDQAVQFMESVMRTAPRWAPGLPIACESSVGKNYAECK
jgi:DNA polymerase I-like protein with 3'-5' exonuclease and polymerase domains